MASGDTSATVDTTRDFLRSFSVIENVEAEESESSDSDFDELTPIPETPGETLEDNTDAIDDDPDVTGTKVIPYSHVFKPAVPFSGQREHCWLPGVPVHVDLKLEDRHPTVNILNPNLYKITVFHGEFTWVIFRRYKHFKQLHDSLAMFRARYRIPLPNKQYHQRRATIMKDIKVHNKRQKNKQQKPVRLPKRPETLVREDHIPTRMKHLKEYLENLMTCRSYRNHPETLKFFEVSHLSFVNKLGIKAKEGLIEKCSGGRRINIQCCGCLRNVHFAGTWNKRWLVVKDNFILYVRPEDGHISDVLLMDSAFSVKHGLSNTGAKHGVLIENISRKLLIKCWTTRKAKEWAREIEDTAKRLATDYIEHNRFSSFAPARESTYARWFVDGRSYFEAVADALEKAKEEIYITDWWLSPEIYLKRPIVDGDKWRLDVVLKRKAEEGVKVFVLLYKEIEAALTIKSSYSKQTLVSQCPENIKVLRHPDHIPGKGVLLWAHHEKLVIIDQQVAFTGGLDLCYGRWDDEYHRMTDLGSISLMPKNGNGHNASNNFINSSNTEVSVLTDDSEDNTSEASPAKVPDSPAFRGSKQHRHNNLGVRYQVHQPAVQSPAGGSKSPVESGKLSPKPDKRHEPIDANVVVMVTDASDEENNDSDGDRASRYSNSSANTSNSSCMETCQSSINFKYVNTGEDGDAAGAAGSRPLLRQQSSVVDVEGLNATTLEEINQSMQPFKDIYNDSYFEHSRPSSELSLKVPNDPGALTYHTLVDKEIICCAEADDIPKNLLKNKHSSRSPTAGRKGKNRPHSLSPNRNGTKSPKQSPTSKRREKSEERKQSTASSGVKASHLWKRRSKNKSLELVIPNRKETFQKTSVGEISENGASESSAGNKLKNGKSPGLKKDKSKLTAEEEPKVRANSDSSGTADLIVPDKSGQQAGEPTAKDAPGTSGISNSAFSFSNTVSAVNALRKMMQRKEQNNNEEDNVSVRSNEDKASAARRRWRMIFNVTKFETIVRTPQVPERIDESLFYNQNIKHPTTRKRLVRTFKEGVDKLKRQGRRDSIEEMKQEGSNLNVPRGMYHTESEEDILERGLLGSARLWIGKDYVNFIYRDFQNLHQPFEDFIDRTQYPRMPWHDIGCVVYGKSARDLARHFIGRWNFTKLEKFKRNINFPLLIPKTASKDYIPSSIKDITFEVKAQVLRSSCGWSAGIGQPEDSIQAAYEHCIENSKDYIYIENQFFITLVGQNNHVNNCIGNALYKRILRAHRSGSNFRVYVVMPLLPAFEGEFGTSTGVALQAVTHWNYSSICRGGNSLMQRLAKDIPDPNKYIVFCGLRTWDTLNNKLMTELIYVHSKLMIVDDNTVIIGSANINDRSLLGTRDSEIAVMFEDVQKVDVTVNGKKYQAGKFASSLRWTIFREHLGIHKDPDFVDLTDITSDSFYKDVWVKRAAVNTTCFDKVFHCLPTDSVKNFVELRNYQSSPPLAQTDEAEARKLLQKVKGYLVLIPLRFLHEENLAPKVGQKEALLPTYLWT